MDEVTYCGIGSCKPEVLQSWKSIKCFIAFYSVSGLFTSSLQSYINSQVTSIEKQFGLSSTQLGFLMSCDEVAFLTVTIIVGYIAPKVHIPRVLSITTLIFGLAAVLCCLPYGLTRLQEKSNQTSEKILNMTKSIDQRLCGETLYAPKDYSYTQVRSSNEVYNNLRGLVMLIIGIGMVLQGVTKAPRSSMIAEYIDENVDKRKTGFYLGIIISIAMFGPVLAYGLGSVFSNLYVTLEDVPIKPRDSNWIGAWWLGFLVFGLCAMMSAVPIFMFPRRLSANLYPQSNDYPKRRQKTKLTRLLSEIKELCRAIYKMLSSPLFTLSLFASVVQLLAVTVHLTFLVKYYERQYNLPTWKASLIMAGSIIASLSIGTFIGGIITRKVSLSPHKTMTSLLVLQTINALFFASGLLLGCDQKKLIGPSIYSGLQGNNSMSCSGRCDCADNVYFPVCGSDEKTYFSPCFAGCNAVNGRSYNNCTCVAEQLKEAKIGICDPGCDIKLYLYIAMNIITSVVSAMKIMPIFIVKMRSVKRIDKALAVGVSGFVTSLFGWLPGPIISGKLIDSACILWEQSSSSGTSGSCSLYDNISFRVKLHGYSLAGRLIVIIILLIGWLYTRHMVQWKHYCAPHENKSTNVELNENVDDERKPMANA